jgi:hypothetical protein
MSVKNIDGNIANIEFIYDEKTIRCEGTWICLTDLWNAIGKPKGKHDPRRWKNISGQEFIASVAKKLNALPKEIYKTTRGRGGASWAHWQIATEYAVYLGGTTVKMALFKSIQDLNVILDALKDFEIPSEIKGTMYVYAIREMDSGNIKLGISRNPKARLKDLQIGNSSRLELVASCEAKNRYQDERLVQKDNQEFHIHGEWFTGEAKLTI